MAEDRGNFVLREGRKFKLALWNEAQTLAPHGRISHGSRKFDAHYSDVGDNFTLFAAVRRDGRLPGFTCKLASAGIEVTGHDYEPENTHYSFEVADFGIRKFFVLAKPSERKFEDETAAEQVASDIVETFLDWYEKTFPRA
jgi:hypothetical protein